MSRFRPRALVWALTILLAAPLGRWGSALAANPRRIAIVEVRSMDPDDPVAKALEEDLRVAVGRKKVFEVIPAQAVEDAMRRLGITRPVPFDDETLAKIAEEAGAEAALQGRLDTEGGFQKARARLVRTETRGTWRRAEEFCLCRTQEGRMEAAERIADELAGTRHLWPSRKRWAAVLGAAALGGIAAILILNNTEDHPLPDGFAEIPDPPS